MRSHEAAHAESESGPSIARIFDHPLVPVEQAQVVCTQQGLEELIKQLHNTPRGSTTPLVAYDSEFIGEETYYPRLCLIQLATTEHIWLVDPLAGVDLTPFWELLADSSVEKIVHAGQQDLEPVVRHLGRGPANIFDTQVGAGFTGAHYPSSLSRLISNFIDPESAGDIGAKFSQWDHRPLTSVQMRYAASDVRYLPLLRHLIGGRLSEVGNEKFAHEEFEELCDPALYRFDVASQKLRVRGVERLSTSQRNVLRSLLAWRDGEARKRDLPPRALVADGVLFEIARDGIDDTATLHRVRGLPRSIKRDSRDLLAAVEAARNGCDPNSERVNRRLRPPTKEDRDAVETLWHAMRERCAERRIDPALVSSKRELMALVRSRTYGRPGELRLMRGWRAELLADILESPQ